MPWWLLGILMVATTFSADTPNLVTDIVRTNGVAGNWVWWAFLLTGMLTVFIYAKLWRRSKVLTDLEFYELRYSGKGAAFLRGFRAFYLGAVFNVLIMASVCLAGIKIGGALLGLDPVETLLISCLITVTYSSIGGLRGIIITDWYSSDQNSRESIKLSIRFLTNEIRTDSLDIKVFNKKCNDLVNCKITETDGVISKELKRKILKTATLYKEEKKNKKK